MEDIITNFELVGTRLLRICPTCGELHDKAYELSQEQAVLREQCPKCGFHFPVFDRAAVQLRCFQGRRSQRHPAGRRATHRLGR